MPKVASTICSIYGIYYTKSLYKLSLTTYVLLDCDCLATAPLPALKHITFSPPLDDDLCTAIKDTHYVKSVKIFLQTKSPFWLEHDVDGMIISDMTGKIFQLIFVPVL